MIDEDLVAIVKDLRDARDADLRSVGGYIDEVLEPINKIIELFEQAGLLDEDD